MPPFPSFVCVGGGEGGVCATHCVGVGVGVCVFACAFVCVCGGCMLVFLRLGLYPDLIAPSSSSPFPSDFLSAVLPAYPLPLKPLSSAVLHRNHHHL